MAVVRNLMVRIGADLTNLKQQMDSAQKTVDGFGKGIKRMTGAIGLSFAGIRVGDFLVDASRQALEMQNSVYLLSRTMGSSAKDFINWASTSASAFNMSRKEAMTFGKDYALMVNQFSKGTEDTKNKTIDLLKASAQIAAVQGLSMQDVMDKISSGLRGETESIQNLGIFTEVNMLKSTNAFKQFANNKSWDQLDIQTQNQIRYFAILEQAAINFGTEIQQNTSSQIQQFTANMNDLKVALGEGIIPIINETIPYLQSFASALKDVVPFWKQFFYTLSGNKGLVPEADAQLNKYTTSLNNQTKNVSKATSNTSKLNNSIKDTAKTIKSLAGFDEINQLADTMDKTAKQSTEVAKQTKKAVQQPTIPVQSILGKLTPATSTAPTVSANANYSGLSAATVTKAIATNVFGSTPVGQVGNVIGTVLNDISKGNAINNAYAEKNVSNSAPAKPLVSKPLNITSPFATTPAKTTTPAKVTTPIKPVQGPPVPTKTVQGPPIQSMLSKKPKLATGGIVSTPTSALIGEAGPEMIVPLQNTSFVDKLSSALGSAVMAGISGSGNSNSKNEVVINIDGNTIARAIAPYTSREASRIGTSMITVR